MNNKKRKIIILEAGGNELSNQLWNYASVYAYTLEREYSIENPSFFEYGTYFKIKAPNSFFSLVFFEPFRNYTKRKTALRRKIWRKLYTWYVKKFKERYNKFIVTAQSPDNIPYYLPPTRESENELQKLERGESNIYLSGWLFRNPKGLQKYRNEIREYFRPRTDVEERVTARIENLRSQFEKVIGVHVRQGDYREWRGGVYFIPQTRIREILDEYIQENNIDIKNTCFLITSDGPIDTKVFDELNIFVSKENAVTDLFLLSSTDTIIGSNSTFGAFASYYGNIPFIVMQKEKIDWEYYRNRKDYFENKYSTFVHY